VFREPAPRTPGARAAARRALRICGRPAAGALAFREDDDLGFIYKSIE